MLSRCSFITSRSALFKSQSLYASTAQFDENVVKSHRRSYHVVNQNKRLPRNLTNETFLKNRNILCLVSARSISDTPITTNIAENVVPLDIPLIPEAPTIPVPEVIDLVAGAEPAFASLGLGGWSPVGIVQSSLEYLHIGLDLPWWGCIVIGTVVVRTALFPLFVLVQRNAAKMNNNLPGMQAIQLKMTEARQMGDALSTAQHSQELMKFMSEKGCNPIKNMLMPLVQAPIFISFFVGIRQMANAPVESMTAGGMFWFTDLTLPDPYFILPAITSATLALTIELGTDGARLEATNMQIMRYVLRAIPIIVFPFIMNFPAAMLCYWTSANFISLGQVMLLKIDSFRDYCKIERLIKHDLKALPIKKKKFVAGVKDSWSNLKLSKELQERQRLDDINFQRAAQGPLVRTYKFDPTKPRPATVHAKIAKKA